jgi:hypothetical protein
MRRRTTNEGLRKHRPGKPFRFEYIRGKYSGMTPKQRWWRAFDEMEREEDGYKDLLNRWLKYKKEGQRCLAEP